MSHVRIRLNLFFTRHPSPVHCRSFSRNTSSESQSSATAACSSTMVSITRIALIGLVAAAVVNANKVEKHRSRSRRGHSAAGTASAGSGMGSGSGIGEPPIVPPGLIRELHNRVKELREFIKQNRNDASLFDELEQSHDEMETLLDEIKQLKEVKNGRNDDGTELTREQIEQQRRIRAVERARRKIMAYSRKKDTMWRKINQLERQKERLIQDAGPITPRMERKINRFYNKIGRLHNEIYMIEMKELDLFSRYPELYNIIYPNEGSGSANSLTQPV